VKTYKLFKSIKGKSMEIIQIKNVKRTIVSLSIVGFLSACSLTTSPNNQSNSEDLFAKKLQSAERSATDRAKDENRKPQQVMQFFGVEKGMTVLELLSSGGYYTEVISKRVGNKGRVIAHNNKFILQVFDGRFAKDFEQHTANNRLPNVEHYIKEFGQFDIHEQVDVATIVLNYHDMYSNLDKERRMTLLSQIKRALKPGGVVGIIDMESTSGTHQPKLHRIYHQRVLDELAEAGFLFEAKADFLKNANDDHSKVVFDPTIRGKADRFVLRFSKPRV